jgi:kynurenine formamidase
MCVPRCTKKIAENVSRRDFLKTLGITATAAVAASSVPALTAITKAQGGSEATPETVSQLQTVSFFGKVVDLTHTLIPNFPTYFGEPGLKLEELFTFANDGLNILIWTLNEHTGTHMDAPFHFSEEATADQIPLADLIGPLAVVDIRAKAEADPDAQLTVEDLQIWEGENGQIPPGSIVAMNSGWDTHVTSDKFRNADDEGVMHFPGFHIDAIELLLTERNVKGIMVDTLSLDHGPSADFAVHYRWLPANKWGLENVANLGELPPLGATAIVGGPKIAGASGGPSRVMALV